MQIIKAQVDIFGNELADDLAKLGASLNLDNEMVTFIHIGHTSPYWLISNPTSNVHDNSIKYLK
jgi:hypothetical protein